VVGSDSSAAKTKRRRNAIAAGVAALVVASALLAWRIDLLSLRSASPVSTVASAFGVPPVYPGYAWTRDGQRVSDFEIATIAGPEHCGWGSAAMMFIGWPPPTTASTADRARQFIRDPHAAIDPRFREQLRQGVTLPADARSTGYRHGDIEVFVSPSDDTGIYLVSRFDAERWPISDPMTLCE
jgi:hypothetical protein